MTVNTVDDALVEINRLRAINQQLLAALRSVLAQFDTGAFVRNTDSDGCSDWAMKAVQPLLVLGAARVAVWNAEAPERTP